MAPVPRALPDPAQDWMVAQGETEGRIFAAGKARFILVAADW